MASNSTSPNLLPPSVRMKHLWPVEDRIAEATEQRVQDDRPVWTPIPNSPQELAYHSEADELFYGGAAGGGKTDLLVGLAGTAHYRSVIFRRIFPSARSIIERSREVYNTNDSRRQRDSLNESLHLWRLASGRQVEFAACQFETNKEDQRGRPRDLYGFDELPEFSEGQYRFITAWNRSTHRDPKTGKLQRCRIVATGNPPTTSDGEWVIRYWAPWLDETHPDYPAEPGKLYWYARIKDEDVEFTADAVFEVNGKRYVEVEGKRYRVRSRTFIPAKLDDNPYLRETDYGAIIDSLPEPLRSQMRDGKFGGQKDEDPWQVIPTAWVKAAQKRWLERAQPAGPMTGLGGDIAHGGKDKTVLAPIYGTWVGELLKYPGVMTPTGQAAAMLVIQANPDGVIPNIDAIGYGASCSDALLSMDQPVNPVNVSIGVPGATDRSGRFGFVNLRSAIHWWLREALDPEHGADLALPDDKELLADLCAPRYTLKAGGRIAVEEKAEIKKRIGRSPDCGEAVMLGWAGAALLPPDADQLVVYDDRVSISAY